MKRQGFSLLEMLVLLVIVIGAVIWALPNLEMARNHSMMQETMKTAQTLAIGLENYRVEVLKDDFVKQINQLSSLTDLNQKNVPWLIPQYLAPQKTLSAWGGHYVFAVDAKTGQINLGVPGRTGFLEFPLQASPQFYDIQRSEDFNRGLIFRDGKMVIGPHVAFGN